uniref:V-type proton ATPase subunit G n=2 Tax=Helianthus annuus TaxID=4232 RepID=A0A251TUP6_HELAN
MHNHEKPSIRHRYTGPDQFLRWYALITLKELCDDIEQGRKYLDPTKQKNILYTRLTGFSLLESSDRSPILRCYMDSSRGQNGIQSLLAAEQEAQQIVNAARNAKLARLKQAKEEAEKEVAEFRAQMEADYQRKLTETSGDSGANVKRLEKETDAKIQHLKTEAERISGDVVGMLLKHVTTVRY